MGAGGLSPPPGPLSLTTVGNVDRSEPAIMRVRFYMWVARETDPTPVLTRSSEVMSRRTDLFHGPQVTHTGRP